MKPVVPTHPQFASIVKRLREGDSPASICRDANPPIPKNTLESWWKRHSKTILAVPSELLDIKDPEAPVMEDLASEVLDERRRRENAERKLKVMEAQLHEVEREITELADLSDLLSGANNRQAAVPDWLMPARKSEGNVATVNLMLSDLHLDEVVKKETVRGVNAYNRRIAEQRLQRTFEKAISLPRDYMAGLKYEGIVVHMAGDTFSGDIHEELARTNEATPLESVLYWIDPFVAGDRKSVV